MGGSNRRQRRLVILFSCCQESANLEDWQLMISESVWDPVGLARFTPLQERKMACR